MKTARSCLLWFALYALLAFAVIYAVERRIGRQTPVFIACAIVAFVAWVGVSHLVKFGGKAGELLLIRKGMNGDEPQEGKPFAAIGPVNPIGGMRLVSPISQSPAVAYSYLIGGNFAGTIRWKGSAAVPSAIRCGANSIRILSSPALMSRGERLSGEAATRHAEEYVRATQFPIKIEKEDGTARSDEGPQGKKFSLKGWWLFEQVVRPGDVVCAIGTYSAARGGITSVRLLKWEPARVMLARFRDLGGHLMNAIVMIALVVAALTVLYAFIPLNAARPSWLEMRLEGLLDERVRQPVFQSEMFSEVPRVESGELLEPGEARGRIRTASGEANVTRATWQGRRVLLYDGPREIAVLTLNPSNELQTLKLLNEEVATPATFTFRRIAPDEVVGRLSLRKADVPAAHAIFRARTFKEESD